MAATRMNQGIVLIGLLTERDAVSQASTTTSRCALYRYASATVEKGSLQRVRFETDRRLLRLGASPPVTRRKDSRGEVARAVLHLEAGGRDERTQRGREEASGQPAASRHPARPHGDNRA